MIASINLALDIYFMQIRISPYFHELSPYSGIGFCHAVLGRDEGLSVRYGTASTRLILYVVVDDMNPWYHTAQI